MAFLTYADRHTTTEVNPGDQAEVYNNGENVVVTVERIKQDGRIICTTPRNRHVMFTDVEDFFDAIGDA